MIYFVVSESLLDGTIVLRETGDIISDDLGVLNLGGKGLRVELYPVGVRDLRDTGSLLTSRLIN